MQAGNAPRSGSRLVRSAKTPRISGGPLRWGKVQSTPTDVINVRECDIDGVLLDESAEAFDVRPIFVNGASTLAACVPPVGTSGEKFLVIPFVVDAQGEYICPWPFEIKFECP